MKHDGESDLQCKWIKHDDESDLSESSMTVSDLSESSMAVSLT